MSNIIDTIIYAIFLLGFLMIFVISITLIGFAGESFSCSQKGKAIGLQAKYNIFAGCIITKKDGQKVLLEQLRDFITK